MGFRGVDNFRLVTIARKYSFFRHSDQSDHALTGYLGIGFVVTLVATFAVAFLASLLGADPEAKSIARPIAITIGAGVAFFACWLVAGDHSRVARVCVLVVSFVSVVVLLGAIANGDAGYWYLYLPSGLYLLVAGLLSMTQLRRPAD